MLVSEDVHQIRSGYHGIYTAVYLITGEYLTLIDSGETETWEQKILPYIRSIGREPAEVKRIIHTHGHDDHSQGDLQIREQTGAEIWISELGAKFLEQPGSRAAWEEQLYDGYLTTEEREAIRLGMDYRGPPWRGYGTVRLHLVKLVKERKVEVRVSEDGVWWSWKGEPGR
jgi:glyoxylase-like metal-dependent hydrolase (beta-lactamase superfamily II)